MGFAHNRKRDPVLLPLPVPFAYCDCCEPVRCHSAADDSKQGGNSTFKFPERYTYDVSTVEIDGSGFDELF